jgi:CO/xanthine dehydrogenase Mo-binding subunit
MASIPWTSCAEKINIDPIELRVRNEPTEDPEKHIPCSSRHLIACLQQVRDGFVTDGLATAMQQQARPKL